MVIFEPAREAGGDIDSKEIAAEPVRRERLRRFDSSGRHPCHDAEIVAQDFRQIAQKLAPALDQVLSAEAYPVREASLAQAYETIARAHNALGITAPLPTQVSFYFNRPYRVIHADNFALDQARISRFEPPGGVDPNAAFRSNPLLGLCWGRLIFDWYTVPATNWPAGAPNP